MEILYSPKFLKKYRQLHTSIKELAEEKELVFRANPFDQRLRTHKLKGKFENFYAFSINNKYRIIFHFINDSRVYFHTVGNHDIYE
jgi:toxin HigB-1